MKSVVITGSTRGIGYALADSFLERGCSVTISGRKAEGAAGAEEALSKRHESERILSVACDVRNSDQVQSLWDEAATKFGKIDIWINNAGLSGPQTQVWKYTPTQVTEVVDTNLVGLIFGSQAADQRHAPTGSGQYLQYGRNG